MLMASFVRLHTADDCRMGLPEVPRHADTGAGHSDSSASPDSLLSKALGIWSIAPLHSCTSNTPAAYNQVLPTGLVNCWGLSKTVWIYQTYLHTHIRYMHRQVWFTIEWKQALWRCEVEGPSCSSCCVAFYTCIRQYQAGAAPVLSNDSLLLLSVSHSHISSI